MADFNGDGLADVAVTSADDNTVTILLGNGDGTFHQAAGSPIPGFDYNPAQVIAADFNGDGIPDLAVANYTAIDQTPPEDDKRATCPSCWARETVPLPLRPGSPITVGLYATNVLAADFNQDGKTDLAVLNQGDITTSRPRP